MFQATPTHSKVQDHIPSFIDGCILVHRAIENVMCSSQMIPTSMLTILRSFIGCIGRNIARCGSLILGLIFFDVTYHGICRVNFDLLLFHISCAIFNCASVFDQELEKMWELILFINFTVLCADIKRPHQFQVRGKFILNCATHC